MTKDEIRENLEQSLNSPTWNALKTSFLGKELIEYAVNVIFLSEQQKLSIQDNQYPDTADIGSMLMMAFNRDLPLDLSEPAYIKVAVANQSLIQPYQAFAKSGNISFTNYDYIVPGREAFLYQGNIKTMFTRELQEVQEYERVPFKLFYDVEEECYFLKLGEKAISDSVRVLKEDGSLLVLSEYDVLREDPESDMVKIKRNTDKSLNVYFGNGKWAKKYDPSLNYQVLWIDGTNEDFDVQTLELTSQNENISFEVLSYSSGKENDITYTRSVLRSKMVENSVAATESQIKEFVKRFPEVIDCEIKLNEDNQNLVTVYVKPTVLEDTVFDQIHDALNLYGEIVTQYQVLRGEPLYFYVQLSTKSTLTQQTKLDIETLIRDTLAYDKLPYVTQISSVYLNELISGVSKGLVSVGIIFRVYFDVMINDVILPTRPYRGSISLKRGEDIIGWDSEGVLYGATEPQQITLDGLYLLGDFFVSTGTDKCLVYNGDFTIMTDNTGYLPLSSVKTILQDQDRILVKYSSGFAEINIDEAFTEGDFSLQKNPTVTIIPYSRIEADLDLENSVYKKNYGVYKVMTVGDDDKQYYLWKYDINNNLENTLNYSVIVSGGDDWTLNCVALDGDNILVFFNEALRFIEDINSPKSAETLRVDHIEQFKDLKQVRQVITSGSFTILEEEHKGNEYIYSIYRSSGFDIEEGQIKRLILKSEFSTVYQGSFEEQQDIRILYADMDKVIFVNDTAKELYLYQNGVLKVVASQGGTVNEVVKLGIVSYVNNQIQMQGKQVQDVTVEYQTADALELLPVDTFPVMKDVEWK